MLVTPVLAFAGDFAFLYHNAHKQVAANTAEDPYAEYGGWEAIPCNEGEQYAEQGHVVWECQKGVRTAPLIVDGTDLTAGLVPKKIPSPKPTSELLEMALPFGLLGFPAGFAIWVLYRAIFFAIKG